LRDCRFVTIHKGARRDAPFRSPQNRWIAPAAVPLSSLLRAAANSNSFAYLSRVCDSFRKKAFTCGSLICCANSAKPSCQLSTNKPRRNFPQESRRGLAKARAAKAKPPLAPRNGPPSARVGLYAHHGAVQFQFRIRSTLNFNRLFWRMLRRNIRVTRPDIAVADSFREGG
jgi:hypothetical protein